jgi:hypothetical protein
MNAPGTIEAAKLEIAADTLRSFGELRFRALGGSMLPSIYPGDTLLVHRETIECFASGDVALFSRDGRFFAHRVVDRFGEGGKIRLVTRGDALPASDSPITHREVLGRVHALLRGDLLLELKPCLTFLPSILARGAMRSQLIASGLMKWASWRSHCAAMKCALAGTVEFLECR